jgi:succinate dehydrogenase / fumarate reductase flavoprotein subunit
LGASALMQGLADGYFVIPYTIGSYLASEIRTGKISTDHEAFVKAEQEVKERIDTLLRIQGKTSPELFHRRLGKIMWDKCGMARNAEGLEGSDRGNQTASQRFLVGCESDGHATYFNPELDKANRVADFIELGELMCIDALDRNESCGGHFREEYQTEEGEALRDDENLCTFRRGNIKVWKSGSFTEKTSFMRTLRLRREVTSSS